MTQQDALDGARKYVVEQCAIMAKYGTPPTSEQMEYAIIAVAKIVCQANRVKWFYGLPKLACSRGHITPQAKCKPCRDIRVEPWI